MEREARVAREVAEDCFKNVSDEINEKIREIEVQIGSLGVEDKSVEKFKLNHLYSI